MTSSINGGSPTASAITRAAVSNQNGVPDSKRESVSSEDFGTILSDATSQSDADFEPGDEESKSNRPVNVARSPADQRIVPVSELASQKSIVDLLPLATHNQPTKDRSVLALRPNSSNAADSSPELPPLSWLSDTPSTSAITNMSERSAEVSGGVNPDNSAGTVAGVRQNYGTGEVWAPEFTGVSIVRIGQAQVRDDAGSVEAFSLMLYPVDSKQTPLGSSATASLDSLSKLATESASQEASAVSSFQSSHAPEAGFSQPTVENMADFGKTSLTTKVAADSASSNAPQVTEATAALIAGDQPISGKEQSNFSSGSSFGPIGSSSAVASLPTVDSNSKGESGPQTARLSASSDLRRFVSPVDASDFGSSASKVDETQSPAHRQSLSSAPLYSVHTRQSGIGSVIDAPSRAAGAPELRASASGGPTTSSRTNQFTQNDANVPELSENDTNKSFRDWLATDSLESGTPGQGQVLADANDAEHSDKSESSPSTESSSDLLVKGVTPSKPLASESSSSVIAAPQSHQISASQAGGAAESAPLSVATISLPKNSQSAGEAQSSRRELPIDQAESGKAGPSAAAPVKEISIRVQSSSGETVHLKVVDQSSQVEIGVRSSNAALASTLRQDLSSLTATLDRLGWRSELASASIPVSASTLPSDGGSGTRDQQDTSQPQSAAEWWNNSEQKRRSASDIWEEVLNRQAP
ncbi:MAG: hypothetical protein WA324_13905 [Bryobacteraceae bacterium]